MGEKVERDDSERDSERLISALQKILERERGKLFVLKRELEKVGRWGEYLKKGEALRANLMSVGKGAEVVRLDVGGEVVEVELDSSKSPVENMERYFALYKKMRSGEMRLKEEIKKSEGVIGRVERAIEAARGGEMVEGMGILAEVEGRKRKKGERLMKKRLRRFISSDGFEIFVGRNERENEYLSLRFGRKEDLFFHASGYAGSHVIVRTGGRDLPESTLYEAGVLAVYYSKARGRGSADVSVTECANVYKPRGGKPGLVCLRKHRVLHIKVKERVLLGLLSQLSEEMGR